MSSLGLDKFHCCMPSHCPHTRQCRARSGCHCIRAHKRTCTRSLRSHSKSLRVGTVPQCTRTSPQHRRCASRNEPLRSRTDRDSPRSCWNNFLRSYTDTLRIAAQTEARSPAHLILACTHTLRPCIHCPKDMRDNSAWSRRRGRSTLGDRRIQSVPFDRCTFLHADRAATDTHSSP